MALGYYGKEKFMEKGPNGHFIKDQGHKGPLEVKGRAKWSFCKK